MGKQFQIGTRMSGWFAIWREKKQKTRSCVGRNPMNKTTVVAFRATWALASSDLAQAQQAKVYRVVVILEGGAFYAAVDGLKDGVKVLGFEEGKHFVRAMRDGQGEIK